MQVRLIQHGSAEYDEMVDLRMELLRRPLGLSFTQQQLEAEINDFLVGAFENNKMTGCCVLTPHNQNKIQLRQMAVNRIVQSKGVGRAIVEFAEKTARENGYRLMMMHARNTALEFYRKCGYEVKGEEFIEVTIPHHYMEKRLA